MKRGLILLAGILLLAPALLYAANPDTAFVVIKCTTTLSIDIRTAANGEAGSTTTVYTFDYVAPGASTISAEAVCLVVNDSVGAIERFKISVSSAYSDTSKSEKLLDKVPYATWNSHGINQFVVFGLFRKSQPADSMFSYANDETNDDLAPEEVTHGDDGGPLSGGNEPEDYRDEGYNNDQGAVLPESYNENTDYCGRKLWLKLLMPKAIDQNINAAYIEIKAIATWAKQGQQ